MRVYGQFFVFGLLIFCMSAISYSDETLIEKYNVKLNPSYDGYDYELYGMLNNYLGLTGSEAYSSSVDLFNDRGINPATQWITNGSSLLHAFNRSAFLHRVNVLTEEGAELCRLYDGGENYVPGEVYPLADGVNLDFQMLPFMPPADDHPNEEYIWAWYSDQSKNEEGYIDNYQGRILEKGDGEIHMLAFDITDLYNAKMDESFTSVYMFAWEDLPSWQWWGTTADFDYNDMVVIMTNLTPTIAATPEPASMLILLLGGGIIAARRLRLKKNNKRD
ncbi:MAG: PEP-CTERM sorting domain-containing protein [Planctomycetaceae bacterium]|jgi:hypothetical protein|nr:PEP-CTERM sorting domain-containing protein [Planctomycetaceae bacterium]